MHVAEARVYRDFEPACDVTRAYVTARKRNLMEMWVIIMLMMITPDTVAVLSKAPLVDWLLETFVMCIIRCYHTGFHLIEFSGNG